MADRRAPSPLAWVGLIVAAAGCALPWYSVGPASRLGTSSAGRWSLALIALAAVAFVVGRVRHDDRALVAGVALAAGAGVVAAVAAFLPPEEMSVSAGPFIVVVGSITTVAAAWRARSTPGDQPDLNDAAADDESSIAVDSSAVEDPPAGRRDRRRVLSTIGAVAAGLAFVVLAVGLWPVSADGLDASPDPTTEFDDAIDRFEQLLAEETDVYEPCHSRLLQHGEATDVAVVLFHGLTNCPRQYVELADALHDAGANVLIMRAPGHGIGTDDGDQLAGAGALRVLSAEGLADWADDAVDLAQGLGRDVRVSGLSMGGVAALWVAQHRDDVERVVAIAPAMELPVVPNGVSTFFTNLFSRVPTLTISHERHIDHDYAAESTRGLAATFALGQAVADRGLEQPAAVEQLTVMLNPDDPLVTEDDIVELMEAWRAFGSSVEIVEFDPIGLRHDLIDVGQPNADPDHVYPLVAEQLGFADAWPV